ncbi:LOW QUALITY PROTEIN: zinc finger BED domain-containing protein 4-like [Rhinophrynus dorsalis]
MVAQWLGEQADTQEQMGFVVTDGAANMIKALRDGRFVGVRCSAHVLHLVVKATLEDGSNTGSLESCQQISGHFHRSIKDSQLLREEQKKADLQEHRLKQDVGTRWNSTLDMLERILEQKKAIHEMSCHHFIGSNRTLGRADWALMEQVVTVLTPFRAYGENASLAEVIPLFTHLSLKLDDFLSHRERLPGAEGNILPDVAALLMRLKKELTRPMEERMDNCPELMLATICDPRIKGKLALRSNSLTAWREQLIARVRERQRKTRMQSQELLARASALSVTARRALWIKPWDANTSSKNRLVSLPFLGPFLFRDQLDEIIKKSTAGKSAFLPREHRKKILCRDQPASKGSLLETQDDTGLEEIMSRAKRPRHNLAGLDGKNIRGSLPFQSLFNEIR